MAPRPFIPVYDCYEAELRFRLGSVVMVNRIYYYVNPFGSFPPGGLAFAGALGTTVINYYLPALATNVLFDRVRVRDAATNGAPWSTVNYTGYFGTWPDVALAANCTCFVRSRLGHAIGVKNGALCVPAPPRSAVVENTFTDEWLAAVADASGGLTDVVGTFGYVRVWVSFREANAWRTEGITHDWGISSPVRTVAPRRRRLRNTSILP